MELYNLLLTSIIIATVCSGLGILMDYQYGEPKSHQPLLYWMRKRFVDHSEEIKCELKRMRKEGFEKGITEDVLTDELNYQFYLKPLVLCVYCFPSFWGSLTFISIHGISLTLVPYLIISVISAIPLTALFYSIYAKL